MSRFDYPEAPKLSRLVSFMSEPARALVRRLWRIGLACRFHYFQQHRHRKLSLEHVDGLALLVLPEAFNPTLFGTSEALCRYLKQDPIELGSKVLDVGTGSGVAAIFAARRGSRVLGVDISPDAVRCARINVLLNELEDCVEIRQGNLFEPADGELFDLVLFNPPFFRGTPRAAWEFAWRSDDILDRFARDLKNVLAPGGRALMIVSSDVLNVEQTLDRHGVNHRVVWQQNRVSERLMIHELKVAQAFEESGTCNIAPDAELSENGRITAESLTS
jgi:HemK-related putative methylase